MNEPNVKTSSNGTIMFRVEFTAHIEYDNGETSFRREEQLPFVPFVGLDILDDALGEFKIKHVAWASHVKLFICQSNIDCKYWTIRQACKSMKKAGWVEEREFRQSRGRGTPSKATATAEAST